MNTVKFNSGEITHSEGRMYQKNIYSLPYELRQFLFPNKTTEGKFFEVDLSNAELCLAGWFYKDQQLLDDIHRGDFWEFWLGKYSSESFTKSVMKACIFCMAYSCSDVTFPKSVPASFFEDFTSRYSVWWAGINRTNQATVYADEKLRNSYKNWVTGASIELPPADTHHYSFIVLNKRVQESLSSYAQILYADVSQQPGVVPYLLNFDSLFVTYQGHTIEDFEELVSARQKALVEAGELPCYIPFKSCSGSNLAESQGWTPSETI